MAWLKRRNHTADWLASDTPPDLDLDAFRLGGAAVGDPADLLTTLGPGVPGLWSGDYEFPAAGVSLGLTAGRLTWFAVHLVPAGDRRPFRGPIRYRGQPLDPATVRSEADAVARFDEPDVVEDTDEGRILTFFTDGTEWELTLAADGRPAAISVYGGRS